MWFRRIADGLRGLFRTSEVDSELDEELQDYIERAARDHERAGLTPEAAGRAARAEVGSVAAAKEEVRTGLWESTIDTAWRDLRYGARMLWRNPGFTAIAVLTLAVGLGATTALLSVSDAVLFKPLPVHKPEELVVLSWTAPPHGMPPISIAGMNIDAVTGSSSSTAFSHLAFRRFHDETRTLADVFAFSFATSSPSAPGLDDGLSGQLVSGNYFSVLRMTPRLGRLLSPDDDRDDAPLVAVISYRLWQNAYAGDSAVVGKLLRFERWIEVASERGPAVRFEPAVATIVGVAPVGFAGTGQIGDAPSFFLPLVPGAPVSGNKFAGRMATPWVWPLRVMGRLKPGATLDDAQRDLTGAFQAAVLEAARKKSPQATAAPAGSAPRLAVTPGDQGLMSTRRNLVRSIEILGAIVAVLLLIVCINLANLLLARTEVRRTEIAVRLAIGAGRGRVVRQLVTEALLMTFCGTLVGLLFARWAKDAAIAWISRANPAFVVEPALDLRVLLLSAGVAVVVAVLVGLIPAWRATRMDPNPSLKEGGPTVARGRNLVGRGLLVSQIALALVLLVTAGLFVRTLRNLQTADVGFNTHDLLLFEVSRTMPPPPPKGSAPGQASRAFDELAQRLAGIPGLRSVAFSQSSLLAGDIAMPYLTVPGQPKTAGEDRTVYTQSVSPGFFDTMEMPVLVGRAFVSTDRTAPVAIVNETLARRFFPTGGAIGRRVAITKNADAPEVSADALLEIVGVVRDAKYMTVREQALPTVFLSNIEAGRAVFAARAGVDPASLAPAIYAAVQKSDAGLIASAFRTQTEQLALTFAEERHFALLSSLFGGLALALTSIGLYGLLSYRVARRTQEIGIRLALGASRARVVRSVLAETVSLVAVGVVIGIAAASAVTGLVRGLLFGLAPRDPIAVGAAALVMMAVAVLAGVVPARRAAKVDALVALRAE